MHIISGGAKLQDNEIVVAPLEKPVTDSKAVNEDTQ
jgi:hypothetical protein